MEPPPRHVLTAFSCKGCPELLPGGEGRSWRVEHVVFKPVADVAAHLWSSNILSNLAPEGFRISLPLRSIHGSFIHDGWSASIYEPGAQTCSRWQEKLRTGEAFHRSLNFGSVSPPPRIESPWTHAHDIVWRRCSIPSDVDPRIRTTLTKLLKHIPPGKPANTVVHSDLCGNILFHGSLPPLVIDFSPIIAPVPYAHAILITDAIAWEGAPITLIEELPEAADRKETLYRAVGFRLLVAALFFRSEPEKFMTELDTFFPLLDVLGNSLD